MLSLSHSINQKCNESIVISGSARSGTTILGKLIHSFKGVEYSFEPPVLFSLIPLIDRLEESDWKLLYETYLYEEFLVNAISGRAINCNRSDDSSIYKVKSAEEVESRLAKSFSKVDSDGLVAERSLAYKMPDIVKYLPRIQSYYPRTKFIIATRKAPELFSSMFRKGWFDDASLQDTNNIWPCYVCQGQNIPFWVDLDDADDWLGMDELHRIAHYYIKVNEPMQQIKGAYVFKYSEFIDNPKTSSESLANELGLQFGAKTGEILASVSRKNDLVDDSILDDLNESVRAQVLHFSEIS